ncbi:hypothetical protein FE77_14805, partial [Staphylococcus aureus]
ESVASNGSRSERQAAQAIARSGLQGIGNCGRNRGHGEFAHPARLRLARNQLDRNVGRVGQAWQAEIAKAARFGQIGLEP